MPDYSKAKIYCIKSSQTDKVYYGSTCWPLNVRFNGHKSEPTNITSKELTQYQDAYIELVEEFPCNTKAELHNRERYYIENNPCVNKFIPGRTQSEYNTEYTQANKEKLKQYDKDWYEKNKEYKRQYQLDNKERIKETKRLYYLAKKNSLALTEK